MASQLLELVTVTDQPLNAETPLDALKEDQTPNHLFYVRNHFDIPVIDPDTWQLSLIDAEKRLTSLSPRKIQALPEKNLLVLMEGAGNGRTSMVPMPTGTPWNLGAVSQAAFTGTSLRNVLEKLNISADTVEVLFTGADRGEMPSGSVEAYARSLPLEVALHPDTMLAWGMNGEPLPKEHGYPLRLLVPGWYGMASVKWLREITLLKAPFVGHFQTEEYVFVNEPKLPDGHPVTNMWVHSLILSPEEHETIQDASVEIKGIAWSGEGEVAKVEVSTDGGQTWHTAQLKNNISPYSFRRWHFAWQPATPGNHLLASRASDSAGNVQPLKPRGNILGYGNNAVHRINVTVT